MSVNKIKMQPDTNQVAIHSDVDTVWGRQHFDPAKGLSWHTFPDGVDTRRSIPLRKKYRRQS